MPAAPPSGDGVNFVSETVQITLLPGGKVLTVKRGAPLQDLLFAQGVEFPCGGRGRCKGCRIKVLEGSLPVNHDDERLLMPAEIADGWRLSCQARADDSLKIELAQWEAAILADDSTFAFVPQEGLGVAVDLGTTTVVAQLLDLGTADVLAVRTGLNAQAQHGADVMSRIEFAISDGGQRLLEKLTRDQIGQLVSELLATSNVNGSRLKTIVIVGNTVMHHLFCGLSLEPLSRYPFESERVGLHTFSPRHLGWSESLDCTVRFLPCLGGFVGSDILAGVLATKLHESEALSALVDLGTNGEIVVGNRERILCASTAAGPAFEGARISQGMRAATGAISGVTVAEGRLCCQVIGQSAPRGICGSGLVDAVATGLELGQIQSTGRLRQGERFPLLHPVSLSQRDIRELQLGKGAIAAGLRILLQQWGAGTKDLARLHLAGAFGNYINRASARRIGLLDYPPEKVSPSGNTALHGAKLALFSLNVDDGTYEGLRNRIRHVPLNEHEQFQEIFVQELRFPAL